MDIKRIVNADIRTGDELQINNWGDRFTVCAVSPSYILANHGMEEYTIIQRKPTDYGPYNGIPKGAIVCGPDWWTFGWLPENPDDYDGDGQYDFYNPDWCQHYMADLESGRTEVSLRRRERIERLLVYRDGMLVIGAEEG